MRRTFVSLWNEVKINRAPCGHICAYSSTTIFFPCLLGAFLRPLFRNEVAIGHTQHTGVVSAWALRSEVQGFHLSDILVVELIPSGVALEQVNYLRVKTCLEIDVAFVMSVMGTCALMEQHSTQYIERNRPSTCPLWVRSPIYSPMSMTGGNEMTCIDFFRLRVSKSKTKRWIEKLRTYIAKKMTSVAIRMRHRVM